MRRPRRRSIFGGVLGALALMALGLPASAGAYVYWAGGTTIGRAGLDGMGVNESFIPVSGGAGAPYGVAVDGSYVY